ncbi:hypothetical protein BDN72DRAFT_754734 [Pluteus cervinus]|uniref:Uncharacterized protein n=1 Tax=Pluteus cervinus TaxID=181527 RepID=A0ACD3BH77_9AGAR|nr:hypothetical protein BDN72DRAFT_754734 [Pluteus cervinus]
MYRCLSDATFTSQLLDVLAPESPARSIRMLKLAHELGCRLNLSIHECLCYQLSLLGDWQRVLHVVSLAQKHIGRTSTRLLNWRARALFEMRHFVLLQGILEEFREAGVRPTDRTYKLLLAGSLRNRDLAQTKLCIQKMQDAGFPIDASVHANIARHHRALGADPHVQSRALDALISAPASVATVIVNGLIQLQLDAHDIDAASHLLSYFDQRTTGFLKPLLQVNRQATLPHPSSALPPIRRYDLLPNTITFNMFLNVMVLRADLSDARTILQKMIDFGIPPTPDTIAALVAVHLACDEEGMAVRLVTEMGDRKRLGSIFRHNQLASHCDPILSVAIDGLRPTVSIYNALLKGLLRRYGLSAMETVFRAMNANDLQPNAFTLHIILRHLSDAKFATPGTMLRLIRKVSSHTSPPGLKHFYLAMRRILQQEKYKVLGVGWKAHYLGSNLEGKPSTSRGLTTDGDFDPLASLLPARPSSARSLTRSINQSLHARGIKVDGAFLSLRMQYEGVIRSDMETAQALFDTLLRRGIHPNEYHYSALMEGYAQSRDMQAATNVMKAAESFGIRPSVVLYTILIVGFARQGDPDSSLRTFQQMIAAGVQPDVPSIDAVASAFFAVGAFAIARRILITLWPYIAPFPDELRGAPLLALVQQFRPLHPLNKPTPILSKQERIMLHLRLQTLASSWEKVLKASSRS